jgi:type II restriction enzyme
MSNTADLTRALIERWRADPGSTYNTWFLWEERLKNFRSIRRGIAAVVSEIEAGAFGNAYRGSSLETVVGSIAEQRQLFKGADHAFLWKPKLRIPDIYESRSNQLAFGRFLNACVCCDTEQEVISAIQDIDAAKIKGLGPAAANLLYFLHPTIASPFNTAIVKGYNALAGARVKLGSWQEYLAMRRGVVAINSRHRELLSNDLGAVAGLLFDIGSGRYAAPPTDGTDAARAEWEKDLAAVRAEAEAGKAVRNARENDTTHTQVQGWLRDLGKALGFDVWIAANDRSRAFASGRLSDGCMTDLPQPLSLLPEADTVRLIDVLWFHAGTSNVAAAFEVEHTTSIYSGIVRMLDLALGGGAGAPHGLFLVAPDNREGEVRAQLTRPAFRRVADLDVRFLPYSELQQHREAMGRFGAGLKAIEAVSRRLV